MVTTKCIKQALKTADPAAWDAADWTDRQTNDALEHCFYVDMGKTICARMTKPPIVSS